MVQPLIVDNVKESQFQVLLGIDFLREAGVCLDMQRCRMTYDLPPAISQLQQPPGRGVCAFSMTPPSSLLFTEATQQPGMRHAATTGGPPANVHSATVGAMQQLDVICPLAPLDVPQQPPPAALPLVPTEPHFLAAPPPPLLPAPGRGTPQIPDLDPPATAPTAAWQPPFRRLGAPSGQASEARVPSHSAGGGPRPPRPPSASSPHGWRCRQRSWRPSSGGWG